MNWFLLIIAGLLEVCWAVGMKYSQGFTRILPTIWTIVTMAGSVALLSVAMRTIPLGTAYAVWTGVGVVGSILFGIFVFHEPVGVVRILCLSLIILGIVGLKLKG